MPNIRNIAIIAHVDHGKTTLVDALLRQSRTVMDKQSQNRDQIMDSNELERERGITIFSKNASVIWKGTKINIIDTPGHADFGGEVERVLKMADGALLLVDAKEGPMPQTRFVLKKALALGLKIIVVINKIDKSDSRPEYVLGKTFDLFVELGADESSAFFPVIYSIGRDGLAGLDPDPSTMTDISPLFDLILKEIPAPNGDPNLPLQILVTSIRGDNFKGRVATGRIENGTITAKQNIAHINTSGYQKIYRITSLITFEGLNAVETETATAGDIVAISGIPDVNIGDTIADPINPIALPPISVEEPTVHMTFSVNSSPFAGREGQFTTSRQIKERLHKELETDVALKISDNPDGTWEVAGRGEFHLAIFLERLRREGYELQAGNPQVIHKTIGHEDCVPYERVFIEAPEQFQGIIIEQLSLRHGQLQDMKVDAGLVFLEFIIPTRGLFGYRTQFLTQTKGLGIINTIYDSHQPDYTDWKPRPQGSLVAHETGPATTYALLSAQDRGILFIHPGDQVYQGQVVGQNSKSGDITVNVCKEKQLTNNRSKGEGVSAHFNSPLDLSLEVALDYLDNDELLEITPLSLRIRKKVLDPIAARRAAKGIK